MLAQGMDPLEHESVIEWDLAQEYAKRHLAENPDATAFKISKKDSGLKNAFIHVDGRLFCVQQGQYFDQGNFSKVKMLKDKDGNCLVDKIIRSKPSQEVVSEIDTEIALGKELNQHIDSFKRKEGKKVHIIQRHLGQSIQSRLNELVQSDPDVPLIERHKLALCAIKAVKVLHDKEITHRDLHAGNILIEETSKGELAQAHVIDFGLARKKIAKAQPGYTEIVGGFNSKFIPPEYIRDGGTYYNYDENSVYDEKSDIYQLGMMLKYQLGLDGGLIERMIDDEPTRRPTAKDIQDSEVEALIAGRSVTPAFSKVAIEKATPNNKAVEVGGYGNLIFTSAQGIPDDKVQNKMVLTPLMLALNNRERFSELLESNFEIYVNHESYYDKDQHELFNLPSDYEHSKITALSVLMIQGINENKEQILKIINRPESNVNIPDHLPLYYALKAKDEGLEGADEIIEALVKKGAKLDGRLLASLAAERLNNVQKATKNLQARQQTSEKTGGLEQSHALPDINPLIVDLLKYLSNSSHTQDFITAVEAHTLDVQKIELAFKNNVPLDIMTHYIMHDGTGLMDNHDVLMAYIRLGAKQLPTSFIKMVLLKNDIVLLKCMIENNVDFKSPFKNEGYIADTRFDGITPIMLLANPDICKKEMFEVLMDSHVDVNLNFCAYQTVESEYLNKFLLQYCFNIKHDITYINHILENEQIDIKNINEYTDFKFMLNNYDLLSEKAKRNLCSKIEDSRDRFNYYIDLMFKNSLIHGELNIESFQKYRDLGIRSEALNQILFEEVLKPSSKMDLDLLDSKAAIVLQILKSSDANARFLRFILENPRVSLTPKSLIYILQSGFNLYNELSDQERKALDNLIIRCLNSITNDAIESDKMCSVIPDYLITAIAQNAGKDSSYILPHDALKSLLRSDRLNDEQRKKLMTEEGFLLGNIPDDIIAFQLEQGDHLAFIERALRNDIPSVLRHYLNNQNSWSTQVNRDTVLENVIQAGAVNCFSALIDSNMDLSLPLESSKLSVLDTIRGLSYLKDSHMTIFMMYTQKYINPKVIDWPEGMSVFRFKTDYIDNFLQRGIKLSAKTIDAIISSLSDNDLKRIGDLAADPSQIDNRVITQKLRFSHLDHVHILINLGVVLNNDQKIEVVRQGIEHASPEIILSLYGQNQNEAAKRLIQNILNDNLTENDLSEAFKEGVDFKMLSLLLHFYEPKQAGVKSALMKAYFQGASEKVPSQLILDTIKNDDLDAIEAMLQSDVDLLKALPHDFSLPSGKQSITLQPIRLMSAAMLDLVLKHNPLRAINDDVESKTFINNVIANKEIDKLLVLLKYDFVQIPGDSNQLLELCLMHEQRNKIIEALKARNFHFTPEVLSEQLKKSTLLLTTADIFPIAFKASPQETIEPFYYLMKKTYNVNGKDFVDYIDGHAPYAQDLKYRYKLIKKISSKTMTDAEIKKEIADESQAAFLIAQSIDHDAPAVFTYYVKNNLDWPMPYTLERLLQDIVKGNKIDLLTELMNLKIPLTDVFALINQKPFDSNSFRFALHYIELTNDNRLFESEPFIKYSIENNLLPELQKYLKNGAKIPDELIRPHVLNAIKNGDDTTIDELTKLSTQSQPLFVNASAFMKAAKHAHRELLSTPYNNGNGPGRWANQRSLALLSNGSISEVPISCIFGIQEAISLYVDDHKPTLDEIAAKANIPKEKVGQIDIGKLKEHFRNPDVLKVIHRQNHDLPHSMRAAAYIPILHEVFKDKYVPLQDREIEYLQLMMLFSVAGREDETGFSDTGKGNKTGIYLYQSYRCVDALEFIRFVNMNWDNYYVNVFKTKEEAYHAAFIVEMMGYPTLPDPTKVEPPFIFSILAKGYSEESFEELKAYIKKYPCNKLQQYTDEELKAFFPPHAIELKGKSDCYLNYMNSAHAVDLMRCYGKGDPTKKDAEGAATWKNMCTDYTDAFESSRNRLGANLGSESICDKVFDLYIMASGMLDTLGSYKCTNIESDPIKLNEVRYNTNILEKFLISNFNKNYSNFKDQKMTFKKDGKDYEISFDEWTKVMNFDQELLSSLRYPSGKLRDDFLTSFVSRYMANAFLNSNGQNYSPSRFDFCQYLQYADLRDAYRDFDKEVEYTLLGIENAPRPENLQVKEFKADNLLLRRSAINLIESLCEDGVAIVRKQDGVWVEFTNNEVAHNVLHALKRLHVIDAIPELSSGTVPDQSVVAQFTNVTYQAIKPYLKFRQVKPPKEHTVESQMVDEHGQIQILNLIDSAHAVGCNHNTIVDPKSNKTGVTWFFDQLENPSTNRDFKVEELSPEMRTEIQLQQPQGTSGKTSYKRGLTKPIPPTKQEPLTVNPPLSEYWTEEGRIIAREVFEARGQPKNTTFMKKTSHTLLAHRQRLFQGFIVKDNYFPITILSDVNHMHTHGERYIWNVNAGSNDKFWIYRKDNFTNPIEGLSLQQLQKNLLAHNESQEDWLINWNEIMVGASKTAIRALACPGDQDFNDEAPLSYRLNFINQALIVREAYGIDVPLLINDGKNPAQRYTEQMIANDIVTALDLIRNRSYPFMHLSNTRSIEHELTVLVGFFEMLTKVPFEKDASDLENFYEYIESLNLTPEIIHEKVRDFKIVGGALREQAYLEKNLSNHILDQAEFEKLVLRQIALNHSDSLEYLLKYAENNQFQFDLNKPAALHLAVRNGQLDCVRVLLAHGASQEYKNATSQSAQDIIKEMITSSTVANDKAQWAQINLLLNPPEPKIEPQDVISQRDKGDDRRVEVVGSMYRTSGVPKPPDRTQGPKKSEKMLTNPRKSGKT